MGNKLSFVRDMSRTLIVISHYDARTKECLFSLLQQISDVSADVVVVINNDFATDINTSKIFGVFSIIRPNQGMNISAWHTAYDLLPNYDFYIFLQDECFIKKNNFISRYLLALSNLHVGLIGESINPKWDRPWIDIANSNLNYSVNLKSNFAISRVDYYLLKLKDWSINPGVSGRHMRSLVWAFRKSVLDKMPPFPTGTNKEECIAAEIAVSKQVESMGLKVSQVSDLPFSLIGHHEWRSDGTSKI